MIAALIWMRNQIFRRSKLTVHLKSGSKVTFTCDHWERSEQGDSLTRLSATRCLPRFPVFISLSDVVAITEKRVLL